MISVLWLKLLCQDEFFGYGRCLKGYSNINGLMYACGRQRDYWIPMVITRWLRTCFGINGGKEGGWFGIPDVWLS